MSEKTSKALKIKWVKSAIGYSARQKKTVRVIGEILPLVLAKYGVDALSAVSADSQKQVGRLSRFQVR